MHDMYDTFPTDFSEAFGLQGVSNEQEKNEREE